ncbi:UNVERIFIED_CONTAM: hypothetical protein ACS92_08670 [Bacillus cereus]|nr:hypothetical protein CDL36_28500 [Escherichia coli]
MLVQVEQLSPRFWSVRLGDIPAPAEFHNTRAKEWRFFEWGSQKILLDPCIMESHLYRYRRGIGKNVVISIVLEFSMFHESLH